MSTERERYDGWRDKQDGSFKAFDVWQAAVLSERERCAKIADNQGCDNKCGDAIRAADSGRAKPQSRADGGTIQQYPKSKRRERGQ